MIKSLQQILRITPMIWAVLASEIFVTSLAYAILSTSGVAKAVSLGASLCLAIALILLGFFLFPRIFFGLRGETLKRNPLRKTVNDKALLEAREEVHTEAHDKKNLMEHAQTSDQINDDKIRLFLSLITTLLVLISVVANVVIGWVTANTVNALLLSGILALMVPFFYIIRYYFDGAHQKEILEQRKTERDLEYRVEIEKETLENEKLKLEMERQRLSLAEEQLALTTKRMDIALETSRKLVDHLHPSANEKMRELMIRAVLTDILQLTNPGGISEGGTNESKRILPTLKEIESQGQS